MVDLLTVIDEDGPDVVLEGGDLAADEGLTSAVLISLFTDRRATELEEIPDGTEDPRGYWFDTRDDRWGSEAWILEGRPLTAVLEERLRSTVAEALAWLTRDGVAAAVDVSVARSQGGNRAEISIVITQGAAPAWAHVWASAGNGFQTSGLKVQFLPR